MTQATARGRRLGLRWEAMSRPLASLLALCLVLAAPAASAETIYLRNGTHVTGKITREDKAAFTVDTSTGRRKIPKADVELLPTPDPVITFLVGLLLAGGGQVYINQYDRALIFAALGGGAAAAGWFATRQIRPTSPSTAAVTAIVCYEIPALIGAFDAFGNAGRMSAEPRYHVEYDAQ
ncbi:MAG: hypothetical protein JWM80_230 [Cyanobacteria bacterium RYN_339]|nr:hypothetical protein [Cyanobacteria bacterium RYN_339]